MAEAVNKNKHTLYRFVSLRNPELTDKKDQQNRFVFHPDNLTGVYFRAMTGRGANETKWQNLQNTSSTFVAYKTEEEIEALVSKDFLAFASWLSRNRTTLDTKEVLKSLATLKVLNLELELNIWDNLFYQVVTQKDFYIKEILMQILVLNNLLKQVKKVTDDADKIILIPILAIARVVLPTLLFEEDKTITNNSSKQSTQIIEPSLEEVQIKNIEESNKNITSLEVAKNEIVKLDKTFQKELAKEYKVAVSLHEEKIKPLIEKFQKDWDDEKRKLCAIPKPENYDPTDFCNLPNVKYPDLPLFIFDFQQKTDEISLKTQLTVESFTTLQRINAEKNNDSYSEIIEKIQEAIQSEQKTISENTNFSTPILLISGVAITTNTQKTNYAKGTDVIINPAFVPERFGVRNIGIADYKKVVSHVCCYDTGEVSHIENIMAKELRSKTTTREHIEEVTDTTETSQEKESLTDSTSTDRFEMQTEVSKLLQEQKEFSAGTSFHAGWGGTGTEYTLDAGANYATNSSKEESNRQAVTQAKDITNRAMERIVTRVRHETIKKTTDRFKEENIHAFDNTLGEHNVSGVYRFINAIYKNEVYNYGKRMMYEFMIPQPSKLHRLGMIENKNSLNAVKLALPLDPRENGLPNSVSVNQTNADFWASKFGIEINQQPDDFLSIGKSYDYNGKMDTISSSSSSIKVPDGYKSIASKVIYKAYSAPSTSDDRWKHILIIVGDFLRDVYHNTAQTNSEKAFFPLNEYKEEVPVSISYTNYYVGNITVTVKCQLTQEYLTKWQKETFNAIIKGYETKLAEYQSSLSENQASRESNPGFYRQIEQLVLRKNCISYLMDEAKMGQIFYEFTDPTKKDLANFHIIQDQAMDNYASLAKFMEQAFEWNNISYNFYPFYWGNRKEWNELYQFDCNDPLFRNFMQAGMARVVVTVKPGFENAVLHFMATNQIWNGGEIPVLGNPLYLSIVDEIKEQEYTIEETWETVVPTALIGLQKSGVAIDEEGLPCGIDCKDEAGKSFKINDNTLGKKILDVIAPTR